MKIKLPKRIKNKWVKALRSGEYNQCQDRLTDFNGGFCCLGVLQHVLDNGRIDVDPHRGESFCMMTVKTERKLGVYDVLGQAADDSLYQVREFLAEVNDVGTNGKRWGFKRIANWIEENL